MLNVLLIIILLFLILLNLQLTESFDNKIESNLNNLYNMVSKNVDILNEKYLKSLKHINKYSNDAKKHDSQKEKIQKNKYGKKKELHSFLQGTGLTNRK